MNNLLTAIVDDDRRAVKALLEADGGHATRLIREPKLHDSRIFHWIYVGDTALHLAAAGYRVEIVRLLLTAGANPNAATNQRRSSPLHYAADGFITGPAWDAQKQVNPNLKNGRGKSVADCVQSVWIREVLTNRPT